MAVANMEYRVERKAKKKAYAQLKESNLSQGKSPPSDPYPKDAGRILTEEQKFIRQIRQTSD